MTIDEIKIGTKFKYTGSGWNHHKQVIQTITRIDGGIIYTDLKETGYANNFNFHIGSNYTRDCKIIQPPSVDTMKKYFVYKGITFIIKIKFCDAEKLPMYVISINEVNGTFEYVAYLLDADVLMLTEHITKLENKAITYVNTTYPSQVDQIKQYLKESGFSE